MKRTSAVLTLGALLALPLCSLSRAETAEKPGAVAYPNNPSETPAAADNGAPVVTDKAACPTNAKCPDKPAPSSQADSATTGGDKAQSGGVRPPATAYPDSPVKTPGAKEDGTAPK